MVTSHNQSPWEVAHPGRLCTVGIWFRWWCDCFLLFFVRQKRTMVERGRGITGDAVDDDDDV